MLRSPGIVRLLLIAVAAGALLVASGGCARLRNFSLKPYRINIQQGNYLEVDDVEQVQPGMTRSQVRFLLGTPMVEDLFNAERWDYVYYFKHGRSGNVFRRHFVVFFEGDEAVRIEKDLGGADAETDES
jgi:outer membrane protein assembly factor BamE